MAAGLLVLGVKLVGGEDAEVREEFLQARDALAGGAGMAALTAFIATLAGEAIIRPKGDDAAAEQSGGMGDGPVWRTAQPMELWPTSKASSRSGVVDKVFMGLSLRDAESFWQAAAGIKTKLDSANRLLN